MVELPNLLVIGAMKAGTSSFHEMLNQHPDIFMSKVKEINYFIDEIYPAKNEEWYKKHFEGGEQLKYRGESSVNYSKRHVHSNVVDRISADLGLDIKIIYLLRNPIKRFVSNFTDGKTYKHIPPDYSINQFVKNNPLDQNPYILTSSYYYQLSTYMERFSLRNILIVEYEELTKNTNKVMTEVFNFLKLKNWETHLPHLNDSSEKRYESATLNQYRNSTLFRKAIQLIPAELKKSMLNSIFFNKLFKVAVSSDSNILDQDSMKLLKDFFKADLEQLRVKAGFQAKNWVDFQ